MDGFLAKGLLKLAALTSEERAELRVGFDNAMALNRKLFGEHSFRKSLASSDPAPSRSVINISLFEVCAVTMSALNLRSEKSAEHRLKEAVVSLVRDEDFQHAITYSTNSTLPVQKRFEAMEGVVRKATS